MVLSLALRSELGLCTASLCMAFQLLFCLLIPNLMSIGVERTYMAVHEAWPAYQLNVSARDLLSRCRCCSCFCTIVVPADRGPWTCATGQWPSHSREIVTFALSVASAH